MKTLELPGSKSITNRDLILASLCDGTTKLKGYLKSDDTRYMIDALNKIGIKIIEREGTLSIEGGVSKLLGNNSELYVHQSGTSMRFLTGLAILNNKGTIILTGDERLLERPMGDLIDGIKQLGIDIESSGDYPPIKIHPSKIINNSIKIKGCSSSQYFTSLLHIGAFLPNGLKIEVVGNLVSKPYIDLTINELSKFGIKVINNDYKEFIIKKQDIVVPNVLQIEGDASALSYIANYIVLNNSEIEITNLGNNTKQGDYSYLEILKKYFGLDYSSLGTNTILKGSNNLVNNEKYREVDFEDMPDVSMSFMTLAPFLGGVTKITGLQTLNLKECRRIDAMGEELIRLGVKLEFDDNSITINEGFKLPKYVELDTYNDHRIAMSLGTLKIYLEKEYDTEIRIINPECVAKTYPKFWTDLEKLEN